MNSQLYPWQGPVWEQLQQLRAQLPHAILIHGPEGIGKLALAEHFAQSLLCESVLKNGQACTQCAACRWFSQYSHPDYRRVRPDALAGTDENASVDDGGDEADKEDSGKTGAKSSKSVSRIIRIAQVRGLVDFMNISTHQRGRRVVLLYPAEALNTESSNALLKMLEEPMPGTVMLLVTHNPDSLLPTILSRCHKFPVSMPLEQASLAWLESQGVNDADAWLAEQGGAPLTALSLARTGKRDELDAFLNQLAQPTVEGILHIAGQWQKLPSKELIVWLQRWLYDIFSVKYADKIRYYPRYQNEIEALAARVDSRKLLHILKSVGSRKSIADHPLAVRLFIEDTLLEYLELCS